MCDAIVPSGPLEYPLSGWLCELHARRVVLALPGSTRREFSYRHEHKILKLFPEGFLDARKLAFLVREGIVMGEYDGLPESVGKSESRTVKVLPDRPSWQIALLLLLAAAGYIISRLADSLGAAMEALFLALWAVPTITVAITLTKRIGSRWSRRHKTDLAVAGQSPGSRST